MLDTGRVFGAGTGFRDRESGRANVGFMKAMGYQAAGLNVRDLIYGRDFVREAYAEAGIPLLACNLVDEQGELLVEPYVIEEVGNSRVAIIGVFSGIDPRLSVLPGRPQSLGPEIKQALEGLEVLDPIETTRKAIERIGDEASVIIVLSQLSPEDNVSLAEANPEIDLILTDATLDALIQKLQPPGPGEKREYLQIGDTYIVQSAKATLGKEIGIIRADFGESGIADFSFERKRVATTVAEDQDLKDQIEKFMQELQKNPVVKREQWRKFVGQYPERNPDSRYLGVDACAKCHRAQVAQWKTTSHAQALQTLVDDDQDAVVRCLSCHTTGYGWATGFDGAEKTPGLAGVQCETCHGPGSGHVASPKEATLIRGNPQKYHCTQCHSRAAVPPITDFDQTYEEDRAKIVH